MPDANEDNGNIGNISLKDLEDFEKAEAEAKGNKQTGTPYKLTFKPAVLGAAPSPAPAPSAAPSPAPAPSAAPTTTPTPSAERQEASQPTLGDQPTLGNPAASTSSQWCDESMEEVEVLTE
jgi:hypothetical protein